MFFEKTTKCIEAHIESFLSHFSSIRVPALFLIWIECMNRASRRYKDYFFAYILHRQIIVTNHEKCFIQGSERSQVNNFEDLTNKKSSSVLKILSKAVYRR
jgi:hypothetical protein